MDEQTIKLLYVHKITMFPDPHIRNIHPHWPSPSATASVTSPRLYVANFRKLDEQPAYPMNAIDRQSAQLLPLNHLATLSHALSSNSERGKSDWSRSDSSKSDSSNRSYDRLQHFKKQKLDV